MPMASSANTYQSAKRGLPFVNLRASTLELCGFHRFRRFLTAAQDRKSVGALIHRVICESGRPENGEKRSINGEKTAFATFTTMGIRYAPKAAAHRRWLRIDTHTVYEYTLTVYPSQIQT